MSPAAPHRSTATSHPRPNATQPHPHQPTYACHVTARAPHRAPTGGTRHPKPASLAQSAAARGTGSPKVALALARGGGDGS
eukprot:scaffold90456_cov67-Phaeocystis_antarctica.AAC.2